LQAVVKGVEVLNDVDNFKGKLELLNRGQRWVVRKIGEQSTISGTGTCKQSYA
jgi:hypothetical protein